MAEKLQKVTLKLYDGEFKRLQDHYPEVGASLVVRTLVHKHLTRLESAGKTEELQLEVNYD